ncbi:hypothetical protein WM40_24235 [Robbsia andropogonis]|uniref:Uncharacterized protein n=1 Tax=Robbsia andropogonis TaxID=28092 RepID=A0A0F5JVE4_9BURK|nr:hypothetical protein [Robbsia andropogonis]KKB61257.1 hypothetical protein WM40_24235 [Robbsia andropogonis]MCP1120887.1 hypothetical protein [Robbsia andropogonis]MCP1130651.1 hypothetical protein [Robbsia andropogonis]
MLYFNYRSIPEFGKCNAEEKHRVWHYSMKKAMHGKILFYQLLLIVLLSTPLISISSGVVHEHFPNPLLSIPLSYLMGVIIIWLAIQISKLTLLNVLRKEVARTMATYGTNVPHLESGYS